MGETDKKIFFPETRLIKYIELKELDFVQIPVVSKLLKCIV